MHVRKLSTELSHLDIAELEAAKHHAQTLGLPLNTHLTFSPYRDTDSVPSPGDIAATFGRLLKHLGMWVPRHTGLRFTYLRVCHADEDGRHPHLHVLLHQPSREHLAPLQAALTSVYGYTVDGGLVADVRVGTDKRTKHSCGYYGSTFDYLTRHKSQKAFRKQGGSTWRASRRDANGRHRGIKCPFVGRRYATSQDIGRRARESHEDARRRAIVSARISAERRNHRAAA